MKRILTLLCVLVLTFLLLPALPAANAAQSPAIPEINSGAALVLDADTGSVLYRKNDSAALPPADTAQLMTVLLALESGKADETVTVTKEIAATFNKENGATNLPLKEGEEVKIRDLLYAVMLGSYSDACKTVAVAVSGSEEAFAEAMTARMTKITGTKSSNFGNADGEPHEKNKVTAMDLALLTREAIKNEEFKKIFGTVAYTTSATNSTTSQRDLKTVCKLFTDPDYKYEHVVGAKSGYNAEAQYTLVSVAEKDGRTLICVILSAGSSQRYQDTISLYDYAFTAFRNVAVPTDLISPTEIPVMNKDGNYTRKITVSIPEGTLLTTNLSFKEGTMEVTTPLPSFVQEGATSISLTVSAKDENNVTIVLGTVNLNIETKELESGPKAGGSKEKPMTVWQKIGKVIGTIFKIILWTIFYVLLGVILIAAALFTMSYVQRRKRLANRRRRQEERIREEEESEAKKEPVYTGRRHKKPEDE